MRRMRTYQAMSRLLSVSEAAALLGVSIHTVYAWVSAGRIPLVKLGRRTLFDPDALRLWVRECSRRGRPAESNAVPGPRGAFVRSAHSPGEGGEE